MYINTIPDLSTIPDTAMLRTNAVRAIFDNISRHTVERWVQSGALPKPIQIHGVKYWQAGQLKHQLYELKKQAWKESRPNGTPQEYEEACKAFAKELGI